MGAVGCGKTTLVQALRRVEKKYKKTQVMEYHEKIIDTPGEYLENRRFYNALIVASYDCDGIALVQDASCTRCVFPPNFSNIFTKPVIGIITKIDKTEIDLIFARKCLELAGAKIIFEVSGLKGTGLEKIEEYIK